MEASKRPAENGSNGDSSDAKKAKLDPDCGKLLFCGTTEWHNAAKPGKLKEDNFHSKNNVFEPKRIEALKDVRIKMVGSGQEAAHVVVVDETGQAWSWGNNEFGQLGQGDNMHRRIPTPVSGTGPGGHTIVAVSLGIRHTLLLTSRGDVLACGDNADGQCAQGEMKTKNVTGKVQEEIEVCSVKSLNVPTAINYTGPPVIKVSAGKEFSMLLDVEGCVWAFGSQEFGQLGNGTDGSYNSANSKVKMRYAGISQPQKISRVYERDSKTKKTKMMQMMRIKDISAGSHHGAMVDELGKVFSWGAGAYGRTGLGEPMDTHTPVWLQSLDHPRGKIDNVMCGLTMTVLWGKTAGQIFMAGCTDNIRKECNMTPKQWYDMGDSVIQPGSGVGLWRKGFAAVGEDGKVTLSNNGPCYGELGMGERIRTTGVPRKSKELDYVHVMKVGTGANWAAYVVRDTEEEDEEEIEEYEMLDQTKIEYTEADMKAAV